MLVCLCCFIVNTSSINLRRQNLCPDDVKLGVVIDVCVTLIEATTTYTKDTLLEYVSITIHTSMGSTVLQDHLSVKSLAKGGWGT